MILRRRAVALAVDRAACGAEHDLRPVPPRGLEDAHRSEHVDVRVVIRALDRHAHVGLCRQVEAHVGPDLLEDAIRIGPNVRLVQSRTRGDIPRLAVGEIVERVHVGLARE